MRTKIVRGLLVSLTLLMPTINVFSQQKFVAYASGAQAVPSNSSSRFVLADVTVNPPALPSNAANLVFRGRGGAAFPPGTNVFLFKNGAVGQAGVLATQVGFPPDSPWIVTFDVTAEELTWLWHNRWYIHVTNPLFPNADVRGQFHLTNGTYNDYDGDGRTDLQVYRISTNTFYAIQSSNGELRVQPLGVPGDSVSLTVDFDGDGRSDFSTARYNAEILWRILPSMTNVLEETRWGSSSLGDFFAAADYDGDGKMDIAVFRAGVWHILRSSDGLYQQEYWGTGGDVPAANDFDRDNKADVTIARSENGLRMWYTRLSTTGQTRITHWGLSSDAFFTGRVDFDGDAIPDILVIRNESGQRVFYVRRSSDSQMQAILWGLPTDLVKLGDYDGDGKTDPAITRAVDGQRIFFVWLSSTGVVKYETFGLSGDF